MRISSLSIYFHSTSIRELVDDAQELNVAGTTASSSYPRRVHQGSLPQFSKSRNFEYRITGIHADGQRDSYDFATHNADELQKHCKMKYDLA
jgi:hypothetical protein